MKTIFQNHYVKIEEHKINEHILHRVTLVPFVRAIVVDEEKKKILLFKDLNSTDNTVYYLPECKIYSNIETYMDSIEKKDILQDAKDNICSKMKEMNLIYDSVSFFQKTKVGSIIDFDNYYFIFNLKEKNLESKEEMMWISFEELLKMCLSDSCSNTFYEIQTVAALLQFILKKVLKEKKLSVN